MGLEFQSRVLNKPGMPLLWLISGCLLYYHCIVRNSSLASLICDVLTVLLCSFAVLGAMFRHLNVSVPVDPLEWQISQETASSIVENIANTIGAAESVFRVAASGRDRKLFLKITKGSHSTITKLPRFQFCAQSKVVVVLYLLSVLGRAASGATIAFAALWLASMIFSTPKLSTNGVVHFHSSLDGKRKTTLEN